MEKILYKGGKMRFPVLMVLVALAAVAVFTICTPCRAADVAPAGDSGAVAQKCPGDTDCDGVSDEEELRLGTKPDVCDTDGDGLSDGVELGKIQPDTIDGCHGLQAAGTNYRKPHVMDPLNPDSDGDGLLDGEEDKNGNGWVDPDESDPSVADTDGDGLNDGVETRGDFDGDGIPDYDVSLIKAGKDCSPPSDISDVDCDGIPNARDTDSDNDGCIDSLEGGWVDANSNGIPDVYDNQAKACPEEASASPSVGSGGSTQAKKEGEQKGAASVSTMSADAEGPACTFIGLELAHPDSHRIPFIVLSLFSIIIASLVVVRRSAAR